MKKVNFLSRNGQNITISAVVDFRPGFDQSEKYPAIVVAHEAVSIPVPFFEANLHRPVRAQEA